MSCILCCTKYTKYFKYGRTKKANVIEISTHRRKKNFIFHSEITVLFVVYIIFQVFGVTTHFNSLNMQLEVCHLRKCYTTKKVYLKGDDILLVMHTLTPTSEQFSILSLQI